MSFWLYLRVSKDEISSTVAKLCCMINFGLSLNLGRFLGRVLVLFPVLSRLLLQSYLTLSCKHRHIFEYHATTWITYSFRAPVKSSGVVNASKLLKNSVFNIPAWNISNHSSFMRLNIGALASSLAWLYPITSSSMSVNSRKTWCHPCQERAYLLWSHWGIITWHIRAQHTLSLACISSSCMQ